MKKFLTLLASLAVCLAAGWVGSLFTTASQINGWYTALRKPGWTPPNWLFVPVWTLLFILMGLALYLVIRHTHSRRRRWLALILFGLQLALNILWSILFFGQRHVLLALGELLILWLAIVATVLSFYGINRRAAYLLLPYLLWVSFAAFLNGAIYWLNR